MIKKGGVLFVLTFYLFCADVCLAQQLFRISKIDVLHGNRKLKFPFAGGMNASIINTMDLNRDGIRDLIVTHNISNKISTFINRGNDNFEYAPKYENFFPKEYSGYFIIKDLNEDNIEDLIFMYSPYILIFKGSRQNDSLFSFSLTDSFKAKSYDPLIPDEFITSLNNYVPVFEDIDKDGDVDCIYVNGNNQLVYYKNLKKEKGLTTNEWWKYNRNYGLHKYTLNPLKFVSGQFPRMIQGLSASNPVLTPRHDEYQMVWILDANNDNNYDIVAYSENQKNGPLGLNTGTADSAYTVLHDTYFPSYSKPVNSMMPVGFWHDINNDSKKDILSSFLIERDENSVVPEQKAFNDDVNTIAYYKNFGAKTTLGGLDSFGIGQDSFLCRDMIDVGTGSAPIFYDVDLDSLVDILVPNFVKRDSWEVSTISFYKNIGTKQLPKYEFKNGDLFGYKSKSKANIRIVSGDLNADGFPDLIVSSYTRTRFSSKPNSNTSISYDVFYQNLNATTGIPYFLSDTIAIDYPNRYGQANMCLYDVNRDGLLDLFVGDLYSIKCILNTGSLTKPVFTNIVCDSVIGQSSVSTQLANYNFYPAITKHQGTTYLYFSYYTEFGQIGRAILDTNKILSNKSLSIAPNEANLYNLSINRNPTISFGNIDADATVEMIIGNYGGGIQLFSFGDFDKQGDSIRGRVSIQSSEITLERSIIYPNPTTNSIAIETLSGKPFDLRIYNLYGKVLIPTRTIKSKEEINLDFLSEGVYMIEIAKGEAIEFHRLVKK
jgi:hypothetical protein